MNRRTITPENRIDYTQKAIDPERRVPGIDNIEFLRIEEPHAQRYRLGPCVRVRYATDSVEEQEKRFSLKVDKRIFLAISDEALGEKSNRLLPRLLSFFRGVPRVSMQRDTGKNPQLPNPESPSNSSPRRGQQV